MLVIKHLSLFAEVALICSKKRTNTKQATEQKKAAKKRKLDKAVKSGRRKARTTK